MHMLMKLGFVATGLLGARVAFELPKVSKRETVNFTNLVSQVDTVYVAPGQTKEYTLYGPWLEWTTGVMLNDRPQQVVEHVPTFTSDGGKLRVKLTGSGSRSLQTATINIGCPPIPFTDCKSTATFKVRVLSVGTITSITPNENVPINSKQHFRVTGTNMSAATPFLFRTDLKNISNVTTSSSAIEFDAYTTSCGSDLVRVRDGAEGGDFYPFSGALDVRLAVPCNRTSIGSGIITGGSTSGSPDLQAIGAARLLRHLTPIRKISNDFCNGMFAQAVTAVVRTITVPDVTWGVKNGGTSNVTGTFHVQLLRSGVVVADSTVSGLNAGASKTFTFHRSQSSTEVARLGLVPDANTRQIYSANGGECVQTVGQAPQFDWQDPAFEVHVDPANAVTNDSNRANNNKSS